MFLCDTWAALHEDPPGNANSSLQPRRDAQEGRFAHLLHRPQTTQTPQNPTGGLGMLQALEDDIATYIARNELRERVRGFVEDALLKLLDRDDDVSAIVVNGHSQGTVLCWDVLCRLPFTAWTTNRDPRAGRIPQFVTAGSPIRKYVDMFAWGEQVGELAPVLRSGAMAWSNFCDPRDPVADPLNPPATWRPGQPWDEPTEPDGGLLIARDNEDGSLHHVPITDRSVSNVEHSAGGGLQAHDYWNNTTEFVRPLADLLSSPTTARDC
jgi:hypothetical protein